MNEYNTQGYLSFVNLAAYKVLKNIGLQVDAVVDIVTIDCVTWQMF